MRGDLEERLVANDALPGHVACLRLNFAPSCHGRQHPKETFVRGTGLQALPGVRRIEFVEVFVFECGDLLSYPSFASSALKLAR